MNAQDDPPSRTEESQESASPTPPDPLEANDLKVSRKREREVSLEPATPQAAAIDIEGERTETKERRTPAKKNRVSTVLDATQEEEEDPALSCSPPHETKIRQISRGVEDIRWQNVQKEDSADAAEDLEMQQPPAPEGRDDAPESKDDAPAVPPPVMQGENPPLVYEAGGEDGHAGEADPAEVPRNAQPSEQEDEPTVNGHTDAPSGSPSVVPPPAVPRSVPHSRRGSDSDTDQEKGLKRKLGDRTVSERLVSGENVTQNGTVPESGTVKRQRDDPDEDVNPRETKRPTPPPEEREGLRKKTEAAGPSSPKRQSQGKPQIPASSSAPKFGGFMAYASSSSPFANLTGPNVFSGSRSPSSWASTSASASTSTSTQTSPSLSTPPFSASPSTTASPTHTRGTGDGPAQTPQKRTGFEAFAGAASPFASAAKRPKSPPPPPPFSALGRSRSPSRRGAAGGFSVYAAGGAQSFAAPTPKRESSLGDGGGGSGSASASASASGSRAGSVGLGIFGAGAKEEGGEGEEEGGREIVSFGERLRSQKDEEEGGEEERRVALTEQEVLTGEEDEETVYQVRGKLFALGTQNQWKERGTGTLRLNVRRKDGAGARLIMRKEAVYTVLLNAPLFKGMCCFLAQDPRYLRFSVFESGSTTHYNVRVSNAKIAEELLEEINSHIPCE
ncbi:hypothetical protein AcV7_003119 [Taiwanofungus camphoratus]|nr:hypothetical protein AcV7_003119 [Antrodia cinnamomea]